MRRKDREVTNPDELIDITKRCDVCTLALNDDGYPYILPLNFGSNIEDGKLVLYFHGATEGKKYELIEKDNRASFEVDCSHRLVFDEQNRSCTMEYESVVGRGRIEFVSDDEKLEALRILMRGYYDVVPDFDTRVIPMTKVFKLTVESMTGKRRMKKSSPKT